MNERTRVYANKERLRVDYDQECLRLRETLTTMTREYYQMPDRLDIMTWQDEDGATVQLTCPRPDLVTIRVTSQGDEEDDVMVETIRHDLRADRPTSTYSTDGDPAETVPLDHFGCVILADSIRYVGHATRMLQTPLNETD